MNLTKLKQLAKGLGLHWLVDRLSLLPSIGRARIRLPEVLFPLTSQGQEFFRLIDQDYQACREQIRRIAAGCPPGNPGKCALLISSYPVVWGAKMEGLLSLALRLQDYGVQVAEVGGNSWMRRYHQAFGINHFLEFPRFLSPLPEDNPDSGQPCASVQDLMDLTYRGVDAGRIILSNLIYRHKFERFDLAASHIKREIALQKRKVQQNILAAEDLLDQAGPALALVQEKGLSPAAEIVGVCLARGIPVIQYSHSQDLNGFILKRFEKSNRHNHPFSLSPQTWEMVRRMPWGEEQEAALLRDLEESYKSGTWFNRKFLHDGKKIKTTAEVRRQLGLDPAKKTAVIFSHVLWDATFFYGDGLFEDYETWLLETLRAACANPGVNWVIKLHPDLVWKLKYEGFKGDLRDVMAMRSAVGEWPEHIKLVLPETDISTYSFFQITDYCLTVRGTIGIEMACHGVPVLTAGTGRYSGLGFTLDAASRDEYLERLAHIQDLPPMTREQTELARRFAYALFKLRPWQLQSFEIIQLPMQQTMHPLSQNLTARVHNFEELSAASDIRRLADWLVSKETDYRESP